MSKAKERELVYGGRRPKDYLPAHNHVAHTPEFRHGQNGFRRFWIPPEWVETGEWKECPCGWGGPKWKPHYATSDHAKWWKKRIKTYGSLEAAQRHEERRLHRHWKKRIEAAGALWTERALRATMKAKARKKAAP
jgi:hypothetical protein